MRLTRRTDIALRIAMRLAVLEEGVSPTTQEVADAIAVPHSHAAKVVARLCRLGVIEARRGRGGGLTLTQAGRTGPLGALVRELEGPGDMAGCDEAPGCPLRAACRLRGALRQALEQFYAALDQLSIGDLVAPPTGPVLLSLQPRQPGPRGHAAPI